MVRASASFPERLDAAARAIGAGALLGVVFLAVQGLEWARLTAFGLTTTSGIYGATFYALVVAHAIHVLAALIVLLVAARKMARASREGRPDDARVAFTLSRKIRRLSPAAGPRKKPTPGMRSNPGPSARTTSRAARSISSRCGRRTPSIRA